MGGAAALLAAPPLDADALVLEMVYPRIDQAIQDRLEIRLGKFGSAIAPSAALANKAEIGDQHRRPAPNRQSEQHHAPKLFIAGEKDEAHQN
jgi:hypothetical protein